MRRRGERAARTAAPPSGGFRTRRSILAVGLAVAVVAAAVVAWRAVGFARRTRAISALRPVAAGVPPDQQERRATLEIADRLLRDLPAAPEALYARGRILLRLGYGDEAVASLRAALAVEPELAPAYELLGMEAMSRGDHAAAVPLLERAWRIDPESEAAGVMLGESLANLGRLPEAVAVLERVVAAHPAVTAAHVQLGQAWNSLREPARAKAAHLAALRLDPVNGPACFGAAQACERLGEHELAEQYRRRHLDIVAEDRGIGQRRIRAGLSAGEPAGALAAAADLAAKVYAANGRLAEAADFRARAAAAAARAPQPGPAGGSRR